MNTISSILIWHKRIGTKVKSMVETYHTLFPKIYSHRSDEFGIEFIVCVSVKKRRLPYSWVSKGQEFNQIIIISISHSDGLGRPAQEKSKYDTAKVDFLVGYRNTTFT